MKTAEETILEKAGELFCMVHSTTCEKIAEGIHEYTRQQVMGFLEWKERYKINWDIKSQYYILPDGQKVKTKEILYDMYILSY